MATHHASYGELLAMPIDELRRDIMTQRALVTKMSLGIQMNKEKDTARYRTERRMLARMLLAMHILKAKTKSKSTLKTKKNSRTIPASST